MALIKCPECELQVSDQALFCPHCGFPMQKENVTRKRKPNKRRRLPNGFGQITEIKNKNLRKPFRAMVKAVWKKVTELRLKEQKKVKKYILQLV